MEKRVLEGLTPERYFYWFEEFIKIPHGSRNEAAVSRFVQNFAKEHGYEAEADAAGNVFMRVPAYPGYENEPALLMQCHLDMVCEKEPGVEFDFEKDSVQMIVDGDVIRANGTTLGADNGKGVAFLLAVAEDKTIKHAPLEMLFTVSEEIGLIGMRAFDASKVTARRMLNTDCGGSHKVCVSSCGSTKYRLQEILPAKVEESLDYVTLAMDGGLSGHGGMAIHLGRADAATVLSELMLLLDKKMEVRFASFNEPGANIHASGEAIIAVPAGKAACACSILLDAWNAKKDRYKKADPDVNVTAVTSAKKAAVLSHEDTLRVLNLMFLLPCQALRHDPFDPSIILTSQSFSGFSLCEGRLDVNGAVRSVINSERDTFTERASAIFSLLGFAPEFEVAYGSWPEQDNGVMKDRLIDAYRKLYGKDPEIQHIHGGLEVSILLDKIPEMDTVGMGPTAANGHTPKEVLYWKQVQDYWDLMIAMLAIKDN